METKRGTALAGGSARLQERRASSKGSYLLILKLGRSHRIAVGSLGEFDFPAGRYVYAGSAQGPGGVAGRVRRHLRPLQVNALHWHIDYLRTAAMATHAWWSPGTQPMECQFSQAMESLGVLQPRGFGASDCGCRGHLVRFPLSLSLSMLRRQVEAKAAASLFPLHIHDLTEEA